MNITKLSFPIMLLGPLFAAGAGAGGAIAVNREQIRTAVAAQKQTQEEVDKLNEERVQHAREMGTVTQSLDDIKSTLGEIKDALRRR